MKPQELTMLALRVVAVYIASSSFVYLAQAGIFLAFPPADGASMPTAAIAAFWLAGPLVIAVIIWCYAPQLGRLAARGSTNDRATSITPKALVGATFASAGTLIFVTAMPSLFSNVMRAFEPHGMFTLPMLVGAILQCVLGFGLVVGSGAASRFVLWLRYAGTGASDL